MSERPHSVAIGAFVVGALLIAVGGILFISGTGLGTEKEKVVMVFDSSVKGLSPGAPVALRGVQIGQVTDIKLILDMEAVDVITVVEAEFDTKNMLSRGRRTEENYTLALIDRGMRAQLNTQSLLTGLLYIQLDFHPGSEIQLADIESDYIQIPTVPTGLERLYSEIEAIDIPQLTEDLGRIAAGLSDFVDNEAFQQIPADIQVSLQSIRSLSEEFKDQLKSSGPRLDQVLDRAADTVQIANTELPQIADTARASLAQIGQAIAAIEEAADEVGGLVAPDSATTYQLNEALRELAAASRAIKLLARTLEEQPEALVRGRSEETP